MIGTYPSAPASAAFRRGHPPIPGPATWAVVAALALTGCGSGSDHTSSATSSVSSRQARVASASALITTGIAEADAKKYQQAQTTFNDVLVLDPTNKYAWFNLGLIAQVQKQPSAAVANYSKAVSADPKYTPAMYNKAILLEATDLHGALSLYRRITSINPKAATAYLRESFVYDRLGDKPRADQARARAIALDKSLAKVAPPGPAPSK